MMAMALPRPSRPSSGPPTAPLPSLPSLPAPRSRLSNTNSPVTPSLSRRSSGLSLLTTPLTASRSPSSALPTLRSSSITSGKRQKTSPSNFHTSGTLAAPPGKGVRKISSIGSFPQPPSSMPSSSDVSPLSTTPTTPSQYRLSDGPRTSANKDKSPRRIPPRRSSRMNNVSSYSSGTSFLNGGDSKSVSLQGLPSPPTSRPSSPNALGLEGDRRGKRSSMEDTVDQDMMGKDGKGNVLVSVRVRPDQQSGDSSAKSDLEWMVDGRRSRIGYRGREGGEYNYDNVFTVHDKNGKVYDSSAKRLVRRVMEGYHGTVFAYGMTGTGKTFSMQGTASSPGIIPLAITDIFSFIRETPQREFLLRVSYLEIYNEKINDLLASPPAGGGAPEEIKLREDSKRGVYATPLKEEIVQSPTQLLRVIARGDNARRVAGTQYNARSSRSHAVVQIVVESRERSPLNASSAEAKRQALLPGGVRVSTLSLIDLAGSERAAEDKERRTEGAHINKSLLTLATVISKLSGEKSTTGGVASKDNKHLPYRDSKLTRLLQPALAGNSLISILCTIQIGSAGSIATAQNHTGETLNTLKFASRAKNNIVSHAKKAQEAFDGAGDARSQGLLDRYRAEIQDLRKQLEAQNKKEKHDVAEEAEKVKELEQEYRHEEQMLEMQLARTALKERIEHLNRLILSSKSIGVNNPRSVSQLSMRQSTFTNGELGLRSARSSTATAEIPVLNRHSSASSMRSFRQSSASTNPITNGIHEESGEGDEDSVGENGDGTASMPVRIRSLQADLLDKNRYISTLEKRLLQARRSSHSRVSMTFAQRASIHEEGGIDLVLREKDAEIAELRARLDDKERMVSALRSAARKRDVADLAVDTSTSSPIDRRSNGSGASSSAGGAVRPVNLSPRIVLTHSPRTSAFSPRSSSLNSRSPLSPGSMFPSAHKNGKTVDEMTRLLDEMITERVQNGAGGGAVLQERVDSGMSVVVAKPTRRTSVRIREPLAT